MPKANRHSKNCHLCRKPFASAQRHKVSARSGITKFQFKFFPLLIVCGLCKSNLHNWIHKDTTDKEHKVTIYDHTFYFSESTVRFIKKHRLKKSKKTVSLRRGRYGSSAQARRQWMAQHAKVCAESLINEPLIQEQKKNQQESLEKRKNFEKDFAELEQQVMEEEAAPLMKWLDSW